MRFSSILNEIMKFSSISFICFIIVFCFVLLAPSKPPKQVQCSDQSYSSLTFTWNKPRCGDRNGPISHYGYILNASVSNVSILGSVNASENGGDVTFTNLIPVTRYFFRVRANNDNLSGSYGSAVKAHTSLPSKSSI